MANQTSTTGIYACGTCQAKYARADHLIRHVRVHTRQRPFACSVCGKAFGRQDLLKRHTTSHSTSSYKDVDGNMGSGGHGGRLGERVHQACRLCSEKKLKCSDEKPCQRCNEKNLACEYEEPGVSDFTTRRKPTTEDASELRFSVSEEADLPSVANLEQNEENRMIFDHTSLFQENANHGGLGDQRAYLGLSPDQESNSTEPVFDAPNTLGTALSNLPVFGDFVHLDSLPLLEDMDLSFLNEINPSMFPFQSQVIPNLCAPTTEQNSTLAIGTEAYKHSCAMIPWNPRKEENHALDEQDLVLPHGLNPSTHSPQTSAHHDIQRPELSIAARDQILALILRNTSRPASSRIAGSFPPLEVLSDLIMHAFLPLKDRPVGEIVHLPSLDLNKQRPHLLCALIAYGAVCSQSPAVQKFGYALQETVRMAINQLVEEEHSALRELGVVQAFYIQLHLGYYSGINRKIEMAEGNSMLGVTMLRRGKRLRADQYCAPEVLWDSLSLSAEQKWLQWVEQESTKRLVYFAMSLDFHVAAARRINTLFDCDEMGTPLPSPGVLWKANDAPAWLTALINSPNLQVQQALPLNKVLRHPHLLAASKAVTDLSFAAFAYLAGSWALVEDYWRMHTLTQTPGAQHMSDFVLNARHAELSFTMETFKSELTDQFAHGAEIMMLQELVFLQLSVSWKHIAHYCGQCSEDDARISTPYIQQWSDSPQSRAAIWHAAQVFRAAKLFSSCALSDIYVIGLYQAAQIMWVWSLLSRTQPLLGSGPKQSLDAAKFSSVVVVLDGEETSETLRFVKAGRGRSHLTDRNGIAFPVGNSAMIYDLAQEIISTNWNSGAMPVTTAETSRVLQELARITRQKFPSDRL